MNSLIKTPFFIIRPIDTVSMKFPPNKEWMEFTKLAARLFEHDYIVSGPGNAYVTANEFSLIRSMFFKLDIANSNYSDYEPYCFGDRQKFESEVALAIDFFEHPKQTSEPKIPQIQ